LATLALCGTLALALAACDSSGSKNGGGAPSSPSSSETPTAQDILARAKQRDLTSATFTISQRFQTSQGTLTSHGTGALQEYPFAEQIATTTTFDGQQVQSQAVYANGSLFTRTVSSSTWIEAPAGQIVNGSSAAPDLADIATLPNATLAGTESVNGVKTFHLRGIGARMVNGQSVSYTEDLWIRRDTYLPEQMTDVANTPQGKLQSTIIFTGWNTSVAIQTPPPGAVSTITVPTTPAPQP
jgi:hypothetical protein